MVERTVVFMGRTTNRNRGTNERPQSWIDNVGIMERSNGRIHGTNERYNDIMGCTDDCDHGTNGRNYGTDQRHYGMNEQTNLI